MWNNDTIAAISTGMSDSGIGIVRISGNRAFDIIDRIYKGKKKLSEAESHTIHYGFIQDETEVVDEVLVSVMSSPRTFTGEDTVEINCHGGIFVVNKVLDVVLKNGARIAKPGEFTKRAFLNGKMDLSQAEAVGDLIASKNEYALKSSVSQLKGSVKKKIKRIRNEIIYHTAFIETALDDPEHINVDGYGEILKKAVKEILSEIDQLIYSFHNGRRLKEGIQTVILGKPNAGKSSLLNILSGRETAIVTDIAGTTRDVLEEEIQLYGLQLNVIDTAGIRDTEDIIERIGVDKAKKYAGEADLIIYVVDASKNLDENDEQISKMIYEKKCIILLNKSDLHVITNKETLKKYLTEQFYVLQKENEISDAEKMEKVICFVEEIPILEISAKLEQGISELKETIQKMFFKGSISFNDEVYITNLRQKEALENAGNSLKRVLESISNQMPEDFYLIDLMDAYDMLGSITGETTGEDLINEIFSKFCMGK